MPNIAGEHFRTIFVGFRDRLLLVKARGAVGARSAAQQDGIRSLFDAAERRAQAATELGDESPVALGLIAQAGTCYAAAILLAHDGAFDPSEPDSAKYFGRLDELAADGGLRPPPSDYPAAREILTKNKPFAFDELSAAEATAAREIVAPTIQWLRALIEPRSLLELRRAGVARIAAAIAALVGGVWLLVWLAVVAIRPPNLALHKPVTASSETPGMSNLAGVTNGDIESAYALATANELNPWVRVDLLDMYRIFTVTVHQRADAHFDQGFPMSIELSDNDKDWVEIGRRDAASAADWTVAPKRRARFVRVRSIGTKLLALTEIEVRGRK